MATCSASKTILLRRGSFRTNTAGGYLNGTLETRFADVMVSYWQGSRFVSPLGGDLF